METYQCLIKGHNHQLRIADQLVQQGTGDRGTVWECSTGNYRWFSLEGKPPNDVVRQKQPRWGWK